MKKNTKRFRNTQSPIFNNKFNTDYKSKMGESRNFDVALCLKMIIWMENLTFIRNQLEYNFKRIKIVLKKRFLQG
jgi:hypothetical protein